MRSGKHFTVLTFVLVFIIFLAALLLRLWHIRDVQFQFDEWLGGWHANPDLVWNGSLIKFVNDFCANIRHYVTSGQTIAWSGLVEVIKLIAGQNVIAVRFVAAFGGAVGAGVVALLGWHLFAGNRWATAAAAMVVVFSVPGVIFGQFADVYAGAIWASSLQLTVYFLWTRRRKTAGAWLFFALIAFISQLFMYTQLWLTAGIFLSAIWESFLKLKPGREIRRIVPAGILYGLLSALHLGAILRIIPWSESFRWYMASYYPMFWREEGGAGLLKVLGYFLWRIYDLFNYHFSLVFNPDIYQPLRWNWVSLPYLIILAIGIIYWVSLRRIRIRNQLSVISPDRKQSGSPRSLPREYRGSDNQSPPRGDIERESAGPLITDHGSLITDNADAVPRLLITTLAVCLIANILFLIPFGGIRQMFFILPLMALLFGWSVFMIARGLRYLKVTRRYPFVAVGLSLLMVCLPFLPFGMSFPAVYRDRLSRLKLDPVAAALDQYEINDLLASEQNIHILEMAFSRDPRFRTIHWPGYEFPGDALDADFVRSFPVLKFVYGGQVRTVHWVKRGYFPPELERALWIDVHISKGSCFEGPGMRRFYPAPDEVVPEGYRIISIAEISGNAPEALHQSIYWPPNSFYLYLVSRQQLTR